MIFTDRYDAGKKLADALADYRDIPDLLVLGLPRGGVPVAAEVAAALNAELDILVVRKLGLPWQPELAVGAIASGGAHVLNEAILNHSGLSSGKLQSIIAAEQQELQRREQRYRGDRPAPGITGRPVILVDDGLATGATMAAAVTALRSLNPQKILVAVPVASRDALERIEHTADAVICLQVPDDLSSIGQWYEDFGQTGDEEVQQLLG